MTWDPRIEIAVQGARERSIRKQVVMAKKSFRRSEGCISKRITKQVGKRNDDECVADDRPRLSQRAHFVSHRTGFTEVAK